MATYCCNCSRARLGRAGQIETGQKRTGQGSLSRAIWDSTGQVEAGQNRTGQGKIVQDPGGRGEAGQHVSSHMTMHSP